MDNPQITRLQTALQCGKYEIKGQFALGSNYTFLVTVNHEEPNIAPSINRLEANNRYGILKRIRSRVVRSPRIL